MRRISFVIALSTLVVRFHRLSSTSINHIRSQPHSVWRNAEECVSCIHDRRSHLRHLQAAGGRCAHLDGDAKRHARPGWSIQRFAGQHDSHRFARAACFRSRKNAGWACSSRDKPSNRACCW